MKPSEVRWPGFYVVTTTRGESLGEVRKSGFGKLYVANVSGFEFNLDDPEFQGATLRPATINDLQLRTK